jgi:hypothetical protein
VVESLVVRMARENSGWGYDRISGALANLGHHLSDQTIGNILKRRGVAPAPKRSQSTTWRDFISAHMAVLAGTDFFTVEILSWRGLVTYYVLFFLRLETRRVTLGGITRHPTEDWITQMAPNTVDERPAASVDVGMCCMTVMPSSARHSTSYWCPRAYRVSNHRHAARI